MASDLMRAVTELRDAQESYATSKEYFDGNQDEVFSSPRLARLLRKTGKKYKVNFARTVVTAVLDRLDLLGVYSTDTGIGERLTQMWERNEMEQEADEVLRWALVYGECYVMVWPDEDGQAEIAYNDPATTRIFYDEERPRIKRFAAKVWVTQDKLTRANLYYPDRIEKYIARHNKPKSDAEFEPYVDYFDDVEGDDGEVTVEPVWPVPNPYDEIPVFHFRTERPRGRPEHADAFAPQDMINKLVITQMSSTDYHGFPQRYVLAGHSPSNEIDDLDLEDGEEGEEGETGQSDGLKAGPGELWWLTGEDLEIGQFDAADPDAFLKPFQEYVKAMAASTHTPVHHFEGMADPPSGESLRVATEPLIKKVEDRKKMFSPTWRQVFDFALRIELDTEMAHALELQWSNAQTYSDKDAWEVVKAKQEAGVPRDRTLREAGYSAEEVKEFATSEGADA